MADEHEQTLTMNQLELMKKLKAIGIDLWGGMPSAAYQPEEIPDKPAEQKKPAPAKETVPAPQKKETGIRDIWKTADETIDWTDALAHSAPTDGLTGRKLWGFYHRMAERVLSGDLAAYTEVLRTANPLGELTDYAEGINMRAPEANRLESTFVCREELRQENPKLYAAAMGLRIARDLLACLPVNEVTVTGEQQDGKVVFRATYPRQKLLHRNFAFIDPVAFAEECWAEFD